MRNLNYGVDDETHKALKRMKVEYDCKNWGDLMKIFTMAWRGDNGD